MAGSSEPAFSFEYKKGAIAPWMITHLFCNSPFCFPKKVRPALRVLISLEKFKKDFMKDGGFFGGIPVQ